MTAPTIVITQHFSDAYPSLDYTALTGGTADWHQSPTAWGKTLPKGWDGSAWWIGAATTSGLGKWKAGTGDLLKPSLLGALTNLTGSSVAGVTWTSDLYDTPEGIGGFQNTSGQWNFAVNPAGLRHLADADQRLRTLHYYTQTYGAGWQVEASLTDGSFAMQTLVLPTSDFVPSHFTVAWIGGSVCQLQLDIVRRTSGSGGIQCPACYLEAPVTIRRQNYR